MENEASNPPEVSANKGDEERDKGDQEGSVGWSSRQSSPKDPSMRPISPRAGVNIVQRGIHSVNGDVRAVWFWCSCPRTRI